MRFIDDATVMELFHMEQAIEGVKETYRLLGNGEATNGLRTRTMDDVAMLISRPAIAPSRGVIGIKCYPVIRSDVTQGSVFTYLLYGLGTGELLAMIDAATLSRRRTAATSVFAASHLAPAGAETLTIFGTGFQSMAQVPALVQAIPGIKRVLVVGRSPQRTAEFLEKVRARTGLDVQEAAMGTATQQADILVTATGATDPVFNGEALSAGTLILALGSNMATKCEVDEVTLRRADRIIVDHLEVAQNEAGDLLRHGFTDWDDVVALGSVVVGNAPGRTSQDEIILFESQGLGIEDLVCADMVYRAALKSDRGIELPNLVSVNKITDAI